jgi:two-component system nitrate/nitrite response regulator NarL
MLPTFDFAEGYASCAAALANQPAVDVLVFDPKDDGDTPLGDSAMDKIAAFVAAGYRVCVYTRDRRPCFLARCRRAGARGVVLKSDSLDTLIDCLVQVARGRIAISSNVTPPVSTTGGPIMRLTERQRQVLAGRARGEPFRRIARKLNISERTAHDHWAAIARNFAGFLISHSPADLERSLGLDPSPALLTPGLTLRAAPAFGPGAMARSVIRDPRRAPQPVSSARRVGENRHIDVPAGTS